MPPCLQISEANKAKRVDYGKTNGDFNPATKRNYAVTIDRLWENGYTLLTRPISIYTNRWARSTFYACQARYEPDTRYEPKSL